MNFRTLSLFAIAAAIGISGCQRKTVPHAEERKPDSDPVAKAVAHDASSLTAAVDAYARVQNPENDAAVRKAMADVDSEMAELEDLVAKRQGHEREKVATKLRRLEIHRSEETTRFAAVQAGKSLVAPILGEDGASSERVEDTTRHVGASLGR